MVRSCENQKWKWCGWCGLCDERKCLGSSSWLTPWRVCRHPCWPGSKGSAGANGEWICTAGVAYAMNGMGWGPPDGPQGEMYTPWRVCCHQRRPGLRHGTDAKVDVVGWQFGLTRHPETSWDIIGRSPGWMQGLMSLQSCCGPSWVSWVVDVHVWCRGCRWQRVCDVTHHTQHWRCFWQS